MKNIKIKLMRLTIIIFTVLTIAACSIDGLDAELTIEDGGGTLTSYKAYTIDSIAGQGTEIYGRIVFWEGLDDMTLVQLSLYGIDETAEHPATLYNGELADSGDALMSMYTITNTGEGYDFGEFSTAKYYAIDDADFYAGLDTYDANVQITMSSDNTMVVASGDIGLNADPVEEN